MLFRGVLALVLLVAGVPWSHPANAISVRIKDIVDYEGVRDNQLVGYGLVVGLHGTGDRLTNTILRVKRLLGC